MSDNEQKSGFGRQWNYRPDVPLQVSPFMSWPPEPKRMVTWVAARWFVIAENNILVIVALISWFWFQPSMEVVKTLSWDWVLEIYVRNFILLFITAGSLHLYFYTWKKQGMERKYDPREMKPKGNNFTFNNQVLDNMFWSLGSGVAFWTAFEVLMFWAMANDYAPMLLWADNPIWFLALFFLTPIWISFHFYWIHRALHWPPLYKLAHGLHHRNTNVGPWSGVSMHPVEHIFFLSSVLIHFVVAAHPIHILFHMQHQMLTGVTSHTGFEGLVTKDKTRLALGTFHHQMHHRYFDCNYGSLELPWDKWFGSFHNGTDESHEQFKQRRAELMKNR